jgi:hypothetical protein
LLYGVSKGGTGGISGWIEKAERTTKAGWIEKAERTTKAAPLMGGTWREAGENLRQK